MTQILMASYGEKNLPCGENNAILPSKATGSLLLSQFVAKLERTLFKKYPTKLVPSQRNVFGTEVPY